MRKSLVMLMGLMIGIWMFFPLPGLRAAAPVETEPTIDTLSYPLLKREEPELKGEAIWALQARLRDLGYEVVPSGCYDQDTEATVRLYQIAEQMPVNGMVSQELWDKAFGNENMNPALTTAGGAIKREDRIWLEVDVAQHRLMLYQGDTEIKRYNVAVGKSSTPSPLGEWKVINKGTDWGNGFGTRWIGLNVPWGIYGIHGTNKPGSIGNSASHGCIRMLNSQVEELYPLVPYGAIVRIVENGCLFPEDFQARTLTKGNNGQNVVYLQSRLKELGIVFDNADGRFGNMTELAVKYWQAWHGMEPDGVADEELYHSLGMIG